MVFFFEARLIVHACGVRGSRTGSAFYCVAHTTTNNTPGCGVGLIGASSLRWPLNQPVCESWSGLSRMNRSALLEHKSIFTLPLWTGGGGGGGGGGGSARTLQNNQSGLIILCYSSSKNVLMDSHTSSLAYDIVRQPSEATTNTPACLEVFCARHGNNVSRRGNFHSSCR